ncbi:MAG: hypothetical protein KF764_29620 [Labilithrix sp.]|nr:hypothetical protein [Labilithrix sp.]MBX3220019.1 hypothetical protein [Labilithrix sp.]
MLRVRAALASGILLAVAAGCGSSPPPAAPPPAPAETPAVSAPDAGAAGTSAGGVDAAALEKLTAEEAKSGSCDPEHKAALEKLLDEVEANVRAKTEDGKPLKIESFTKRVLALSEAAKGIQLTLSGKGTQVHVIAFSPKEVSLDALAGNAAATTMRSSYKAEVTNGPATITLPKVGGAVPLEGDSRQIEMKPGSPLEVRMRGQGCAGVVVFSKS